MKIRRQCKCGCEGITNYGKKWICGHTQKGKTLSEETRLKISLANKGQRRSKETKLKMSLAQIGNTNLLGYKYSEERKLKFSLSLMGNTYAKGMKLSDETKRKMSIARKGIKFSDETKNKMSLAKRGIKRSKETKKKMSIAKLEHWQNPEYQKKQKEGRDLRPNKPEQLFTKLLNKLYPEEYKYVGDFQFWLGGKNPDFMNVNGQKKLIELYGDYWHIGQNPKDRIDRIDHFKQYGFNTLVIWEHELKKSRLNLRRKLKDFHRR